MISIFDYLIYACTLRVQVTNVFEYILPYAGRLVKIQSIQCTCHLGISLCFNMPR